ncbi:hypothetical protein M2321_002673 [Rhodoblastus acidophilus]|nr:hypothetical protein [Rhodoblastus acidophilus]
MSVLFASSDWVLVLSDHWTRPLVVAYSALTFDAPAS